MATAHLINGETDDTGTRYEVDTWPAGEPPFEGPADRAWSDFRLSDDGDASFEWRTPNDRIAAISRAYVEGRVTLAEAVGDAMVQTWLRWREYELNEALSALDEEPEDLDAEEFHDLALRTLGATLDNAPCSYGYYLEDADGFLHDALRALPLPDWARADRKASGGPGSGFDAAFLWLAPGKTLRDLEAWLAAREAQP